MDDTRVRVRACIHEYTGLSSLVTPLAVHWLSAPRSTPRIFSGIYSRASCIHTHVARPWSHWLVGPASEGSTPAKATHYSREGTRDFMAHSFPVSYTCSCSTLTVCAGICAMYNLPSTYTEFMSVTALLSFPLYIGPPDSSISFLSLIQSTTTPSITPVPLPGSTTATATATPPPPEIPTTHPFSLASSFAPVPAKLVQKIRSGAYIDMKDLLPDNVTARENAQPQSPNQPRQREIKSVLTWISAFITYTAILTEAFPARTKELLAYMRVILREARRSKDNGWLSYLPPERGHQPTRVLG